MKRYARLLLPYSGSLGPQFPTLPVKASHHLDHRYYDRLRLPNARLGVVRSSLSTPDTLYRPSLPLCLPHCISAGLVGGAGHSTSTPGFRLTLDLLIPSSYPRKHLDLPSPQATPMDACPGLRPRWCPRHIAIAHQGLLPSAGCIASAFLSRYIGRLSSRPRLNQFRGSIHSLHPRSIQLRTPITGLARGLHY